MSLADLAVGGLLAWNHFVLAYFLAINTYSFLLVLVGFGATRRARRAVHRADLRRLVRSPLTPPISVIVPAHNEAAGVVESVRSLLMLHYPEFEVVVVNDGSTDGTLDVLRGRFKLRQVPRAVEAVVPCRPILGVYESPDHPNLVVVDKVSGGSKADALNAGLNLALYPLFCAIDADSILEDDALLRAVRPFIDDPGVTVATGGIVRIANGSEVHAGRVVRVALPGRLLARFQVVEYLRGFLFGRMGWSALNGLLIISGAFGLFEKRAVVEAGGFAADSQGEDMELVVRLHRHLRARGRPFRLRFVPDPVCWTEAPESRAVLARQRARWQRGLLDTLIRHRDMIGNPRYGVVGLLALPSFLLFELLGPVVEMTGYVVVPLSFAFGLLDLWFMLAFLGVAMLYGVATSVAAVLLEDLAFRRYPRLRDLGWLVLAGVLENFGYRQATAWWRLQAMWTHVRGRVVPWGAMERRGFRGSAA